MKNIVLTLVALLLGVQPANAYLFAGGSPAASSTRQVASGLSYFPNTQAASTSSSMITRKCGFSRPALTSLRLIYAGGYVRVGSSSASTGQEIANDNAPTVNAWVEYPIGTYTQAKFSGVNNGSLTAGALLTSDAIAVTIPDNTNFCVFSYQTPNTGHISYLGGMQATWLNTGGSPGEKTNLGTSGVPTTPAAFTGADNTSGQSAFVPVAVIGNSNIPAVCLIGDSIDVGFYDVGDSTYLKGTLERSIGASYADINTGVNGDFESGFAYSNTMRKAVAAYCTAVVDEYGTNDINHVNSTVDPAAVLSYKKKVAWLFSGGQSFPAIPYSVTTYPPFGNSSSDSFATCTNQTVNASSSQNTNRKSLNASYRTIPAFGISTYFEIANVFESNAAGGGSSNCTLTPNDGYWLATGSANGYTSEGTHPNQAGNVLVATKNVVTGSGAISASVPTATDPTALVPTATSAAYTGGVGQFGNGGMTGGFLQVYNAAWTPMPFTISLWVKVNGTCTACFFAGNTGSTLQVAPAGGFFRAGGAFNITSAITANDNAYHYLEVSVSNTASLASAFFCIDGVSAGSNVAGTITSLNWNPAAFGFNIRGGTGLTTATTATLNDVALFNYSRYAANGNACPAAPLASWPSNTPGLIVNYPLGSNGNPVVGPAG